MASSSVVPPENQSYNSLYQMAKDAVWVLRVTGTMKKDRAKVEERFGTAVAVNNQGGLISCAHIIHGLEDYVIDAGGLDTEGFTRVQVAELNKRWDLCLMKVEGIDDGKKLKLADDGSLYQGERLICIANPSGYVGSFGLGHALFPCVKNVTIPSNISRCLHHDPSGSMEVTPEYRVMGHIWNEGTIRRSIKQGFINKDDYYTNLHPSIPIIQCGDISFGQGCLGAPVLNTRGEVVGILASDDRADKIAIHVTLIREFLVQANYL